MKKLQKCSLKKKKKAPAKAQKSAEAYETYCKKILSKDKKRREQQQGKKQYSWWPFTTKSTPIRRELHVEDITISNNLEERLL